MAEFLVSLNPANWPESIPLRHVLHVKDVVNIRHTHVHEISLRFDIGEGATRFVKELRWWAIAAAIGFIAWKSVERWRVSRAEGYCGTGERPS
ncbi:hypothetical protein TWF696_003654 [Orbilia brochopaga]|uniref:Uncharacterized protein n=1 Tax=Orbilia brochopaga TaxID=3140254 RepID=A0AAV9VA99_9PEZI